MSKPKPQILKGFRDFLPEQMLLRQRVIGIIREVFEKHGFEPIDTPAIEYLEILTGKAGENEKLMYQFLDQGEREVGLRYDLTVPLARLVAMHQNELVMPFKRYHIAPVWRAEKPQRGRFREFWQCDADIVGTSSMIADAEAIAVMAEALEAIGLVNAEILINHRGLLLSLGRLAGMEESHAGVLYRTIDKLDKIGPEAVQRELAANGVDECAASRILDLVSLRGAPDAMLRQAERDLDGIEGAAKPLRDLHDLLTYLADLGVPRHAYRLDFSLARGLDYYTGPVFEAVVKEPKIGSVGGAGRYDGLVGTFLGRDIPATGMSLGIERILEVVQQFNLLETPASVAHAFMVSLPATLADAGHLARELRAQGLHVDLSMLVNRGLGDQLKYADRRGIPLAIIPGEDEISRGKVSVKHLPTGEQIECDQSVLAEEVRRLLNGPVD